MPVSPTPRALRTLSAVSTAPHRDVPTKGLNVGGLAGAAALVMAAIWHLPQLAIAVRPASGSDRTAIAGQLPHRVRQLRALCRAFGSERCGECQYSRFLDRRVRCKLSIGHADSHRYTTFDEDVVWP